MVAALAALLCFGSAAAQTVVEAPVVRTSLDPARDAVIGQPVRLRVEVLFPGEMPHPPLVKVAAAPGAQILRFETQAVTVRDRIGGQDYVGQSFEFVVFPRRGGKLDIPAPIVTMLGRGGDPAGSAKGEATSIDVAVPPGIDPSGPVLVADKVSASESWSPDPGQARFKPGSAIVRTIRRQADGVPALGMAEFSFAAPDGVRVYVDPPIVEDSSNRGNVEGRRTDRATYVFERAGVYQLPELTQPWWSSTARQARAESLEGLTVTVAAGASPSEAGTTTRYWPLVLLTGLATVGLAWHLLWPKLVRLRQARTQRYRSSEDFARRALLREASEGDPSKTYEALRGWLGRLSDKDLGRARSDSGLAAPTSRLERVLFAGPANWDRRDGAALADAVAAFHRRRIAAQPMQSALPPLNPPYHLQPGTREAR